MTKKIILPFTDEVIASLHTGENLSINGPVFVFRDAVHKKLTEAMTNGKQLPFDIKGATVYYMGPTPAKPDRIIGAAGPTTSGRMDRYSPQLIEAGLKAMIGKGKRSQDVKDAMIKNKAVYLGAIGGAGAILSNCITASKTVAYEELGAEALLLIQVKDFPVTVINDIYGGDLYEEGKIKYGKN